MVIHIIIVFLKSSEFEMSFSPFAPANTSRLHLGSLAANIKRERMNALTKPIRHPLREQPFSSYQGHFPQLVTYSIRLIFGGDFNLAVWRCGLATVNNSVS